MELIFKDSDDNILGRVKHSDFLETLIPAFSPDAHDMFLKHVFASKPSVTNWQINRLEVKNGSVDIYLVEFDSPSSIVDFAKSQNKKASYYIKPYRIVEVDFGFYSDIFSRNGSIIENSRAGLGLLKGEMQKRRPCIVLEEKGNCVQVIPMSSKKIECADPLAIKISPESFTKMAPRYTENDSHALLGMIQTVSVFRVFPPRNENFKYEHKYNLYKLSETDKESIQKALSKQYSQSMNRRFNILDDRFKKLSQEKSRILDANNRIKAEYTSAKENNRQLESFIIKLGNDLGLGDSLEDILQYESD